MQGLSLQRLYNLVYFITNFAVFLTEIKGLKAKPKCHLCQNTIVVTVSPELRAGSMYSAQQ
jgi:hypothetical protein